MNGIYQYTNRQKAIARRALLAVVNTHEPVKRTRLSGVFFRDGMAQWRGANHNYSVPMYVTLWK
jgi:hypothetical protein